MTLRSERAGAFSSRDWAVLAVLLVFAILFHWPLITPNLERRQAYPEGDFYNQFYAFATYEHDRLWDGAIPLWNPYTFGGHPFLADVQAAVFYPPSLLVMLLSGPGPFSPWWLELEAIAHLYLASVLTYLFVRRLIGLRLAALVSALAFAYGGYMTGYPPLQLAILETQAWLPLILLLLDLGLARRRWRFVVIAGLVWGVSLLAGHPQSAMYVFYAALCYGLFCAWRFRVRWWRAAAAQLAWIATGVGLAGVYLVPSWEYMRLSVRASATYEELAAGFGWRDLAQYVLPGRFTHWSPVYVGILPLLLALLAVILTVYHVSRSQRDGSHHAAGNTHHRHAASVTCTGDNKAVSVAFWSGLALLTLVLALGDHTPLYRLFYWAVPGFNLFRSQERAIYVTSFALAVLAGYGWFQVEAWLSARPKQVWRLWIGVAVIGATALDLWAANAAVNFVPGRAQDRVYGGAWLLPVLQDQGLFRVANEWGLPGNSGCWLGLQDLYGASPLRLQIHKMMADAVPHWRLWQLFGVRYVAGWEHDLPGPFDSHRVAIAGQEWEKDAVYVHRLEPGFPRAWVVHEARQASDLDALGILSDPDFDPFVELLLPETGVPLDSPSGREGESAVVEVVYAPEEIIIEADLDAPGWLVLGEWFYPGWQAWVDGTRTDIYRADYGLRAVPLPAGSHHVEFRFRPPSFYLGLVISLLSLGAALFVLFPRRNKSVGSVQT